MSLTVTHSTVVAVADDGTSPIGSDEWNAAHTIAGSVPVDDPLTVSTIIGGTGNSTLTLESTSGTGTTDKIVFKTGLQVEAWRMLSSGNLWSDTTHVYSTSNMTFGGAGTPPRFNLYRKLTTAQVASPVSWIYSEAPGDNVTNGLGTTGQLIQLADPAGTIVGTKGNLWGQFISIQPSVARSNGNGTEDANGLMIKNDGTHKATSAIYISTGANATANGDGWQDLLELHGPCQTGIDFLSGTFNRGIDLRGGTYTTVAIATPTLNIDTALTQYLDSGGGQPALQTNALGLDATKWMLNIWRAVSNGPQIELGHSRGAVGTHTVVANNDDLGIINFMGSDGTQFRDAAYIRASVDGTPGAGDMPGRLAFATTLDGSNSPTIRMTINNAGVVTFASGANFDASGALSTLTGTAPPAGGSTTARLIIGSTSGFGIYIGSGAPTVSAAKGSLYLRTDGTTTNDRAYINTNGSTTWTALTTVA